MKKILIIEDDELINKVLIETISKAGFSPTKTVDAFQGQQALMSLKPDLVILDLMLPAGHGLDVLRNIRSSFQTQNIPIIILTAIQDEGVRAEVESQGVQAYIKKPFDKEQLIGKIKQILGQ